MKVLGATRRADHGRGTWRRLNALVDEAGLAVRMTALGEPGAADRLSVLESQGLDEGRALVRALVDAGGRKRVQRLLHLRRKLGSLLTGGDPDLMWRYVAFVDALRSEAKGEGAADEADDD